MKGYEFFCMEHGIGYTAYDLMCPRCETEICEQHDTTVHDFDPSGDEHPGACMCPCCDQAEGKMDSPEEEEYD